MANSFLRKDDSIGCKSPLLKHVVSFRRYVYMILQDNLDELDLALNFRQDELIMLFFVTTNNMKCFFLRGDGSFDPRLSR